MELKASSVAGPRPNGRERRLSVDSYLGDLGCKENRGMGWLLELPGQKHLNVCLFVYSVALPEHIRMLGRGKVGDALNSDA